MVSCVVLHHFFVECCCCNSGHKGVFFNVGNGTTANGAEMLCRTLPTKPAENASNSSCPPKYRVRRPGDGHLVSRSDVLTVWFLGGGFKYFLCSSLSGGDDPIWRSYFSDGLKLNHQNQIFWSLLPSVFHGLVQPPILFFGGCELALPYELAEPNLTQCPEDLTHVVKVSQCLLAQFFPFWKGYRFRTCKPFQSHHETSGRDAPRNKTGGSHTGPFKSFNRSKPPGLKLLRESPGLGYEAGDIFGLKYGGHIASHEHPYGCFKNLEDNYITCLSEVPKGKLAMAAMTWGFWMFFDVGISWKLHLQDSKISTDLRFNHRFVCVIGFPFFFSNYNPEV